MVRNQVLLHFRIESFWTPYMEGYIWLVVLSCRGWEQCCIGNFLEINNNSLPTFQHYEMKMCAGNFRSNDTPIREEKLLQNRWTRVSYFNLISAQIASQWVVFTRELRWWLIWCAITREPVVLLPRKCKTQFVRQTPTQAKPTFHHYWVGKWVNFYRLGFEPRSFSLLERPLPRIQLW